MSVFFDVKIIVCYSILSRDWRGLAESARLDVGALAANSKISNTSHTLHRWSQAGGNLGHLFLALENMDRFDVIHDASKAIKADHERMRRDGLPSLPLDLQEQQNMVQYEDDTILTVHDRESLEKGGGLTHYDALLLHADEDIEFVKTMLAKLEDEYGLKVASYKYYLNK